MKPSSPLEKFPLYTWFIAYRVPVWFADLGRDSSRLFGLSECFELEDEIVNAVDIVWIPGVADCERAWDD